MDSMLCVKGVSTFLLGIFVTFCTIIPVSAIEYCYVGGVYTTYCEDGYHCCDDNVSCCSDSLAAGAIVGIVIGCLIFAAIVAAVVIICYKGKGKRQRRVNNTVAAPRNVTVTHVHQPPAPGPSGPQFGQPGYGQPPPYGQQPPAYGQQPMGYGNPPPSYPPTSDPTYPPPPAHY